MLVIGPNVVSNGLSSNSLLANDSMCLLGPSTGGGGTTDPITRLFLVVGKLLYLRKIFEEEAGDEPAAIQQWTMANAAAVNQVVAAKPAHGEWEVVWNPHIETVNNQTTTLGVVPYNVDRATIKVMEGEAARVLGIDPSLPTSQKVEAVIAYMQEHNLALQDSAHGLRDYLSNLFTDTQGKPAEWPTSSSPSCPDEWITSRVIDNPTGGQTWIMVL